MIVEGVDDQGNVLSSNTSEVKNFENNWGSGVMRFRPHENATGFRIQVPLSVVATSTSGSVYIDSLSLRAIRPHMNWLNGSIAETAVSTGGRSFTLGTTYGQSLVADLLEDGVSGVKGYVYDHTLPQLVNRVFFSRCTHKATILLKQMLLQIPTSRGWGLLLVIQRWRRT